MGSNISTYSSEIDCAGLHYFCPGKRKSKNLKLQLLCLKDLVTKFCGKCFQILGEKKQDDSFKAMCFHALNCKEIFLLHYSSDG